MPNCRQCATLLTKLLAAQYTSTRLSMPYDSDESSSEPDLSVLAMTRARHGAGQQMNTLTQDEEALPEQAQHEVQGASVARQLEDEDEDEDDDEDGEDGMEDEDDQESEQEEPLNLVDPADVGLKEISNLGRFTVSSHKPGNGVEELRSDDLKLYWQCVSFPLKFLALRCLKTTPHPLFSLSLSLSLSCAFDANQA